VTNC